MNPNANQITHPGIIETISGNVVLVKIQPQAACGSCHSKSFCNLADSEGKVVETTVIDGGKFKIGQEVQVTLQRSLGYRALLLGYLVPFVLLVATILFVLLVANNESLAALMGVAAMVPYYALLFRFRDRMKKQFEFKIKQ
jgi:positive regulator of sigma E activity